mmetsp:Transcript_34598/g.81966  ORF Transcript_34598/g.81966 Transcript_34598/m.81966 type:complete len:181 (-) Transcript_34598:84-626(-)
MLARTRLAPLAAKARSMSTIGDKLWGVFVQAPGLDPSQAQNDSTKYRKSTPIANNELGQPKIPQGPEGREFTINYYDRDTVKRTEWTYKDAEGNLLPQTNMKNMDGTPYMKQFTPPPLVADHLPKVIHGRPPGEKAQAFARSIGLELPCRAGVVINDWVDVPFDEHDQYPNPGHPPLPPL